MKEEQSQVRRLEGLERGVNLEEVLDFFDACPPVRSWRSRWPRVLVADGMVTGSRTCSAARRTPYKLGAAIAGSAGLTRPGSRSRVVVPKYVGYFSSPTDGLDDDDYRFSVLRPVRSTGANPTVVPNTDVASLAVVQSRCRPARTWGVDWDTKLVAWVQVRDDGDYVYTPDFSHAVPVAEQDLAAQIDRLIADDVAVLRQLRGRS